MQPTAYSYIIIMLLPFIIKLIAYYNKTNFASYSSAHHAHIPCIHHAIFSLYMHIILMHYVCVFHIAQCFQKSMCVSNTLHVILATDERFLHSTCIFSNLRVQYILIDRAISINLNKIIIMYFQLLIKPLDYGMSSTILDETAERNLKLLASILIYVVRKVCVPEGAPPMVSASDS